MAERALEFDEALPPFAQVLVALADMGTGDAGADDSARVDQVRVLFPVELEVVAGEDDTVSLGGSPPLLRTRTAYTPVFHQLTVHYLGADVRGP